MDACALTPTRARDAGPLNAAEQLSSMAPTRARDAGRCRSFSRHSWSAPTRARDAGLPDLSRFAELPGSPRRA